MTMRYSEYKVLNICESGLGVIFTGASGLPLAKIQNKLNKEVHMEGWQVVFQVVESKRFWLFWQRDSMIITLGR